MFLYGSISVYGTQHSGIKITYLHQLHMSYGLNAAMIIDSMVQPQMNRDRFRNVSNLDLVELNRIRDSIYAFIRLLFANFSALKISHTCSYCSMM